MQVNRAIAEVSVTGQVRRDQIVRAAIAVVAEVGLAKASFARIAERAGVASTRMISYHFADRDDLLRNVVSTVFAEAGHAIEQYLTPEQSPSEQLRAVITGNIRYAADHRPQIAAVSEIWHGHRDRDGARVYGLAGHELEFAVIGQILAAGQEAGQFRTFDTRTMAVTLRHALDGAAELLVADDETDVDALIAEVTATFVRAAAA